MKIKTLQIFLCLVLTILSFNAYTGNEYKCLGQFETMHDDELWEEFTILNHNELEQLFNNTIICFNRMNFDDIDIERYKLIIRAINHSVSYKNFIKQSLFNIEYDRSWTPERISFIDFLIEQGAEINKYDEITRKSILEIVKDNNNNFFDYFLNAGVDINIRNGDGRLLIYKPIIESNLPELRRLFNYGANFYLYVGGSATALAFLVEKGHFNRNHQVEIFKMIMSSQYHDFDKLLNAFSLLVKRKVSPLEGSVLTIIKPLTCFGRRRVDYSKTDESYRKEILKMIGDKIIELMDEQNLDEKEYKRIKKLIRKGLKQRGRF